jgi:exodeoxyribonuclease V alpha subunit
MKGQRKTSQESLVLTPFDRTFARELCAMVGAIPVPEVQAALGLATAAVREGNVCVPLREHAGQAVRALEGESVSLPKMAPLRRILLASPFVSAGEGFTPLVLDDQDRLYLRRYWLHEREVARGLRARAARRAGDVEEALLAEGLARLFPAARESPDWQKVAALSAALHRLAVISGGPGTGKTRTVVRILALLVEQRHARGGPELRVELLAPTGKAAARLTESIRKAKTDLPVSAEVLALIPEEASTIHRALGVIPGSATRFRHDAERPLLADVVVVDEASMVDLALMRRLLDAVPAKARLVLLGDKDQLSSVEAGSVLGDICGAGRAQKAGYSARFKADALALANEQVEGGGEGPGLTDSLVELRYSHRFGGQEGIGRLAKAVQAGDGAATRALFAERRDDVVWVEAGAVDKGLPPELLRAIVESYRACLERPTGEALLGSLERFRVLCGHRQGPRGVFALNGALETALQRAGVITTDQEHYVGRPVLVTANDYGVRLFNGDLGVVVADPEHPGARAVVFASSSGEPRRLAPARLPPHETVFAMSVHKSQGSELEEILVALPPAGSPLLTRELLYTAATRAKKKVTIFGTAKALEEALARPAKRASGLGDALWGAAGRARAKAALSS